MLRDIIDCCVFIKCIYYTMQVNLVLYRVISTKFNTTLLSVSMKSFYRIFISDISFRIFYEIL